MGFQSEEMKTVTYKDIKLDLWSKATLKWKKSTITKCIRPLYGTQRYSLCQMPKIGKSAKWTYEKLSCKEI